MNLIDDRALIQTVGKKVPFLTVPARAFNKIPDIKIKSEP